MRVPHNFKDLSGQRFGKLNVIEKYDVRNGKTRWLCKCDCGNERIVTCCNLTSHHTVSCGCVKKDKPFDDLSGRQFERLTVLRRDENRRDCYVCRCSCENETIVSRANLLNGNTTSCGCYNRKCIQKRVTKHGDRHKRLYSEWIRMKDRANGKQPTRYTEKHIFVCEEWKDDYLAFREWALSHNYEENLSLDRINNSKGYSPDNCRWANRTTQNRNKDNNIPITYKGETYVISEWAEKIGMKYATLYSRIKRGWSVEEAIERPLR